MPIYTLKCNKCSYQYDDLLLSVDNIQSIRCPKCKSTMKRVYNAVAFKFNTNGFYATDYKKKGE